MLGPLLYAMIFIGVLMIVEGVYLLIYGKSHSRESKVNRRLRMLQQGADREEVLVKLRKERERHQNARGVPLLSIVFHKAAQANIAIAPTTIVAIMAAIAAVAFIVFSIGTSASLVVRLAVALALGYATVFLWLRNRAKRRLQLFEEQLPDAIDLIVRSLRIGHPFTAAIGIIAQEMPDPLGTEFGVISDENAYGMPVTESLDRLAARVDVPDLRYLAVAVTIQVQSGGNLAEILDGLSQVVRARFKLFRKVAAITAEARWSGWFLSIFPIIALLLVQIVQPDYYDRVSDHPLFAPGAAIVTILLVVNVFFMRWMVNIRV
ncbi:type II secretion system F family protein [Pikeienuella piscinae]|uniref:Type II secretion system F family protein n=1 Tax=Pikeienuella piscinae TaxID=2748098 RepID=A0A7M3T5E1_9RHOB|nr:type II secretion system F family protein [Pikeienuella piscinae]QIE57222.1 type II secretion system F family protein [Pikeienuella piscinae]